MGVMLASQDNIQLTPPRFHNDPPRKRSYSLSSDVCLDNRLTTGRRLIEGEFFFFFKLFFLSRSRCISNYIRLYMDRNSL